MISRKSAYLISCAYEEAFTGRDRDPQTRKWDKIIKKDDLYNFLFINNHSSYILFRVMGLRRHPENLSDFILGLHTGLSIIKDLNELSLDELERRGQIFLKKLAEDIVLYSIDKYGKETISDDDIPVVFSELRRQLEIDGFIYVDGKLYESEANIFNSKDTKNLLVKRIEDQNLKNKDVVINHLNLSEEHYLNQKWGDCIANSRNFLEALLQEVANKLSILKFGKPLDKKVFEKAVEVRQFLQKVEFLDQKEQETISKIYALLSDAGSHPNISRENEARLMRNLALVMSEYILTKYIGTV